MDRELFENKMEVAVVCRFIEHEGVQELELENIVVAVLLSSERNHHLLKLTYMNIPRFELKRLE
jgi:hypothetical protein